jgi:hypothetical protein
MFADLNEVAYKMYDVSGLVSFYGSRVILTPSDRMTKALDWLEGSLPF